MTDITSHGESIQFLLAPVVESVDVDFLFIKILH